MLAKENALPLSTGKFTIVSLYCDLALSFIDDIGWIVCVYDLLLLVRSHQDG